ncbi:tigger transposable element-derived protein 6-like [Dreissena polymorpha]|uniref:tigger transposable element-derived protein 6-like n=1 Tax=Dreissena polymorpha TaxID=45954 RepID=UPI002265647C|nr:tigger transposable element-derived protein 6-like [Dreissena polymorpha]
MSQPPAKRRRVELTLEDKIKLITESTAQPKPSLKALCERFKIGKSTVGDILKKKNVYQEQWEKNASGSKFHFDNECKFDRLNELTWEWFSRKRAQNFPLSGPVIQEKASSFAKELGLHDFKGSSVKAFKVSGESAGVDQQTVSDFKSRLPDIIQGYSLENIFNADETGLYYKALPDKTLAVRGDGAKGFKVHKDRITVLFACSATGEKLTPLVIGKAANPHCLKNVRRERLGVTYVSNKRAWMTSAVFSDWLRDVNSEMRRKGRKILLFLDNASSHTADMNLSHVQLSFLPANTTSALQPLDQGVIRAFKAVYRRFMLRALLATMEKTDDAASVSETKEPSDEEYPDDDIPLADLVLQFRFKLDDLTSFDNDDETHDAEWESDIVNGYKEDATDAADLADATDDVDHEEETPEVPPVTIKEIRDFALRMQRYGHEKDSDFLATADTLLNIAENKIVKEKCTFKQRVIMDFFVKP